MLILSLESTITTASNLSTVHGARAIAALKAGHDLLLFGQDQAAPRKALQAIEQAVRSRQLERSRIEQARRRVRRLKRHLWRRLAG